MPAARSTKRWLAQAAKALAPQSFWRRKYGILQRLGESRTDVQLVASLCDPNRVSLDIGADVGEDRRPVEEFDAARHQDPANIGGREDGWAAHGVYVNNFVFLPRGPERGLASETAHNRASRCHARPRCGVSRARVP
jgi:hypothetical protein